MAGFAPALLAPPTPEEQDAALVANVVDPQALGASQVLPPPPPPAPVANLPLDALMAAASAPPPVAPTAPVDAALAPVLPPQGGPALSVLPPPEAVPGVVPGAPATPVEAAKKTVGEVDALGREIQQLGDKRTELETQQADEKKRLATERETALAALQQRQELHRTQAADAVAEARSKAESQPYHTFWESRSIGQNVATAIGLILGGVSWNPNHVNRGVALLEKMMDQDLALQKEKHADLWRSVEAAERGERALDARELRETAAFEAARAAKADAIAGRLGAMIAANKGKGDTATAKKAMLEFSMRANAGWQNAESAAAAAAHLKELEKEAEEANRIREIRANKYKTKGGGTGGAIASGLDRAAAKLAGEMEAAIADKKPMTDAQIRERAIALGIPAENKAGRVSLKTIRESVGKESKAANVAHTLEDKDRTRVVRDPVTGAPYAIAETAKNAAMFRKEDQQLGDAERRMKELAEDITKYGRKVTSQDDIARRITKFANAIIAVGIVSPLGKTNETLHLETKSLGIPGAVDWDHLNDTIKNFVLTGGANIDAVKSKAHEIANNRAEKRRTLTPLTPEQVKMFSSGAEGGEKKGPPAGSKAGRISDGRAVFKYPDGTIHLPDGSEVTTL
jgi:hypothetical protein